MTVEGTSFRDDVPDDDALSEAVMLKTVRLSKRSIDFVLLSLLFLTESDHSCSYSSADSVLIGGCSGRCRGEVLSEFWEVEKCQKVVGAVVPLRIPRKVHAL